MRSWVLSLPIGVPIWAWDEQRCDYTQRTVSAAQGAALVSETQRALAHWRSVAPAGKTPYTPPVLTEHERSGQRLGSLVDAKLADLGEGLAVYLLVDWTNEAAANIVALKSRFVSIGTVPSYRDGDGTVFGPLVDELSLTEHPRLKSLGTIQDTLGLRLADAPRTQGTKMSPEEMLKMIEELVARIDALEAWKAEAMAAAAEADSVAMDAADGADGADAEDEMLNKLSDKVAAKVMTQLKGMRLGGLPAQQAPTKPAPKTPLETAKAAGKQGRSAVLDSLKQMAQ